ncbi:MAG: formate dehydrogenase accessory sulfurtransferase FdhD [Candidatus Bathyarchaeia archaeon]
MSNLAKVKITKINVADKKAEALADYVAQEKPLHIFIHRKQYATIFCSPKQLKELVIGYLFSEGVIKDVNEIEKITVEKGNVCHVKFNPKVNFESRIKLAEHFSRIILSACGGGPFASQALKKIKKIESNLKVDAETIHNCVNNLNYIAKTFRKTGGVHAAAIHKPNGKILAFAEDVGRHNAVDKVIGKCLLKRVDFSQCFLVSTGRLTSDVVSKAARAGIPIVASLTATLDSSIGIAKKANMTLIGFVRGRRMNVYTAPERIKLE